MKSTFTALLNWFESRLKLRETVLPLLTHPVPKGVNWWYVFGSATLTFFMLQVVTGICLAMVYVPSTEEAYESLNYLNYHQPLGWFLRALHYYGATGMVMMLAVHMTQVFLWGAYKYPRELTWLVGVVLLALTLGLAFSGQVLRWDTDAYWGIGVMASAAGRAPVVGPQVVETILGGPTIGAATLSRFFALHVFVLPILLVLTLAVHLHLVVHKGISEPPVPGKKVDPATYDAEYEKELVNGEPFFPDALYKDGIFSILAVLTVVAIAAIMGPYGPGEPPDPTMTHANPRPDWYFLSAFALMALMQPELEEVVILILPVAVFGVLAVLPFVDNKGERAPQRRPFAVLIVVVLWSCFFVLVWLGFKAPWSPPMTAWSGDAVPPNLLDNRTPLEATGAAVFQNKTCRNCHALEGIGGVRGPDLTAVGTRLTHDELIRQVLQGGGNMPAYGQQLSPPEVEALVAFLGRLRPPGEKAAQSTSR
ncbi:MAG: cytochrome b N-terminal domain-containing protein [Planctomycetia bacterium]|nr:cytochrome b N-terminal domain-containing protein [Planctomycetia bacterium]